MISQLKIVRLKSKPIVKSTENYASDMVLKKNSNICF